MQIETQMTLTSPKVHSVRYDDKRTKNPPIRTLYISKGALPLKDGEYPKTIKVEVTSDDH